MKLRYRLILRTVSLAALLFGLFGAILLSSAFHLQFTRERNALEQRSAHLAQSMEAASVNYALQNIPLTGELLSGLIAQLDAEACLYDESGSVLAGSEPLPSEREGIHLAGHRLFALRSIRLAGNPFFLLTASDLSPVYQIRRSLLLIYSLFYAVMVLAFFFVMRRTARSLTQPIERLAYISMQLASGQMSERAQPDDTQETRALALSFNQMADALTGQIERQNRFIADLTHEMKTPLTAIIGHADLIRTGRVTDDEAVLAAQRIFTEGRRLSSLSARLIDLILLGRDALDLAPVFIPSLIEERIEALRAHADECGVRLTADCADAVILCDRPLFSALLSNLLDNALKSGAKAVRTQGLLNGSTFALTISDDGCGMNQETLSHIAEPFYRADKSRSRALGGAGLGLTLCAEIARLHGASLSFESEPGKGTSVTLTMLGKEASPLEEM